MSIAAAKAARAESFSQYEFLAFSAISFIGKSLLLVRLPYRPADVNAVYTALLLLLFYGYFRFRYRAKPPAVVLGCLAIAVSIDVLGNLFGLYGKKFGPVQYDEFSHCLGSAFSYPPALWLLRTTTTRAGHRLPLGFTAIVALSVTFSFCAYYEILELWDEKYYGGKRLWTPQDSANDLQMDLAGIIAAAIISVVVIKLSERSKAY